MTVEIGWQESGIPQAIQALIDATGFSPRSRDIWERAVAELEWPSDTALSLLAASAIQDSQPGIVHEFLNEMAACIVADDEDDENALTYAAVRGTRGVLCITGPTSYLLPSGADEWTIVQTSELSAPAISGLTGDPLDVVLGLDEWASEATERYPLLLEHPCFGSDIARARWQECLRVFSDDSDEDMFIVPAAGDVSVIVLGNSWDGPHFGPLAPDANADFHRLRTLAIALAAQDFEVIVDFGPFVQDFEAWGGEEYGERGLISFVAAAPSLAIHSDGRISHLRLVDCPEELRTSVITAMRHFGLPER